MARVLIVDDSPNEVAKLTSILKNNGFDVVSANSGSEGVTVAKETKPDLVLMDIVMPGVNGFQATRQLKKDSETGDIPVIIVTSKKQETDRIWGERQGASGYLVKPVDEKLLLKTISGLLP